MFIVLLTKEAQTPIYQHAEAPTPSVFHFLIRNSSSSHFNLPTNLTSNRKQECYFLSLRIPQHTSSFYDDCQLNLKEEICSVF